MDINDLIKLLPEGYENACYKTKAMTRKRTIKIQKTKEEIEAEKVRIKKMERKKQRKLSDETVFPHSYMFVITSLPSVISAAEILSCYRLRWQVELVFKRLKSLLELGSIPTKTEEAGEAWINGKILLSLLTEKYLGDTDFSPSRDIGSESEYMERNETGKFYNIYDDTTKYTDNVFRYSKTGGDGFIEKRKTT